MEQGPNERKIIEQARKLKMPLPDKIKNKPEVSVGLELYWRAFSDLNSDRHVGMSEGPIPWSAIHRWGVRHNIWGDDFERLSAIIQGMDSVFLDFRAAQQKKKIGKGKSKSFNKASHIGGKSSG